MRQDFINCTFICATLMIVMFSGFLFFLGRDLYGEALWSFLMMLVTFSATLFSYTCVKIIDISQEKYASLKDPKLAEIFLLSLGDISLELFFSSFHPSELIRQQNQYVDRLAFARIYTIKSPWYSESEIRNCKRFLKYISKNRYL